MESSFQRKNSSQDVTWFLDLRKSGQLDLNPPYQRRSVWTRNDRQFFLDTIFRGYPSPAVFLHKETSDDGRTTYHVVDGKQRLETILDFVDNKLRLGKDYGDIRLSGKKWDDLAGEPSLRQHFWNYSIPVEFVNLVDSNLVNDVFDRLNRNSRKLTKQELRHAKFSGWFATTVEGESNKQSWKTIGLVTAARAKRMADVQALSELFIVLLERQVSGFDQDALDEVYAKYDRPDDAEELRDGMRVHLDEEAFFAQLESTTAYLLSMETANKCVSRFASDLTHIYPLWAAIGLHRDDLPAPADAALQYAAFMEGIKLLAQATDLDAFLKSPEGMRLHAKSLEYWKNSRGASTDLTPRVARYKVVLDVLRGTT